MRNRSSFWDETPRAGDLVWCHSSSIRHRLGLVINIIGYDYWNFKETFPTWRYEIWIEGEIHFFQSWKVTKV